MIIQELATYYDSLVQLEKVGAIGWSKAKVSYGLQIDNSGQLVGIITLLQKPNGVKKEIPQEMIVPEQVKRSSGVSANFLCDNSTYFLGFDDKGRNDLEKKKNKERAKKCFEAAKALHHKVLDGVVDEEAEALLKFFDQWNPEQISDCEILKDYADILFKGANLIFSSQSSKYLHENILIKKAWDNYRNHESVLNETGLCLVSGERKPIARLHPNIKGIFGAQSSGASLVSYNTSSLDSYNKEQGMNAPVSEDVAFKYGAALNYLISDKEYNKRISDTTIVYWAENAEVGYQEIWGDGFSGNGNITQDRLNSIASDMRLGKAVSYKDVELYGDTKFCVLGIVPNAARLSVSFYSEGSFGDMLDNMIRFYDELSISKSKYDEDQTINIWSLLNETANKKTHDKKVPSPIVSSVFRSILEGIQYPVGLFDNVMLRIKAEHDITWRKAAIIKAYLIRCNNKEFKEVLTMELNESSENIPYVLGRTFAVLEMIQRDANPNIQSTIRDNYFTSACATPATIFPILFRLSQHHLRKIPEHGTKRARGREKYDKIIADLQSRIHTTYPSRLNLQEQGVFYLGYYHQRQSMFTQRKEEEK